MGGRRETARGEYRFSSRVKFQKKEKNYALLYLAGKRFFFYIYEVITWRKKKAPHSRERELFIGTQFSILYWSPPAAAAAACEQERRSACNILRERRALCATSTAALRFPQSCFPTVSLRAARSSVSPRPGTTMPRICSA